jgi:hypothetical protein
MRRVLRGLHLREAELGVGEDEPAQFQSVGERFSSLSLHDSAHRRSIEFHEASSR